MREFRNILFCLTYTSLLIKYEISVSRMLQYVFVLRMKRATEAFLSYALKRHLPICFCMSCRAGQHVKCLCEFVKLFCMNSWNCIWKIKWLNHKNIHLCARFWKTVQGKRDYPKCQSIHFPKIAFFPNSEWVIHTKWIFQTCPPTMPTSKL